MTFRYVLLLYFSLMVSILALGTLEEILEKSEKCPFTGIKNCNIQFQIHFESKLTFPTKLW